MWKHLYEDKCSKSFVNKESYGEAILFSVFSPCFFSYPFARAESLDTNCKMSRIL